MTTRYQRPWSSWHRGLLFRGFYQATGRGNFLQELDDLNAIYHSPHGEIDQRVRHRLTRLLQHAVGHVPFYQELQPVAWEDIQPEQAIEVLARFPILNKDMIRQEGARLHSRSPGEGTHWDSSGGSTGEPIKLIQDREMKRTSTRDQFLFMSWLGYRPGEPHLHIWGVPERELNIPVSGREHLYRFLHNQHYQSCFAMSDNDLRHWLEVVRQTRPAIIEVYVDAIYQLSRLMLAENHRLPPPRGIITGAGVQTESIRATITEAFGCPVLNRYGSREVGDMACSCPKNTELHVAETTCYLEVVDDLGMACPPGVEGRILVTLLSNLSMPLIRYEIKDRAAWAEERPCPCGQTTRRLSRVVGRTSDYFVTGDGHKVNGHGLIHLTFNTPNLKLFQYCQVATNRVELRVVPLDPSRAGELIQGLDKSLVPIRKVLTGVTIDIQVVEQIPPSPSGKFLYIINKLGGSSETADPAEPGEVLTARENPR